ncbi:MAG TPA: dihydropteroate synthase [Candidatus Limnocylindrales bacterium]|nr:dihydropteroate synthase [Candidatus Limnocylindrales bacterium]
MTERHIPSERNVVAARPELGGGAATPSFALPDDATSALGPGPGETRIGRRRFRWGSATFVMGILNVTPDSFSGDGLLLSSGGPGDPAETAVGVAMRMADEGADLLDIGGESTRPGHDIVSAEEEMRRVVPVVAAVRAALPEMPLSIDTTKPRVAAAALDAGADLVNDVWGVAEDDALARLAAERSVPLVVMHNRAEARYRAFMAEVIADLERALERALAAGCGWEQLLVDPGFGFGKTPEHNLELLRSLSALRVLGRPIVLGTSRKSTLGKVLDLPADQRLEATLATTALAAAAGIDMVRVHDVRANVRVARMTDAVVRRAGTGVIARTEASAGT